MKRLEFFKLSVAALISTILPNREPIYELKGKVHSYENHVVLSRVFVLRFEITEDFIADAHDTNIANAFISAKLSQMREEMESVLFSDHNP